MRIVKGFQCIAALAVWGILSSAAQAAEAQLGVSAASVPEGNPGSHNELDFRIDRSGDTSSNITIPYSVSSGSAVAGSDYVSPPEGAALHLPAGATVGSIKLPVIADLLEEADKNLTLNLGAPRAYEADASKLFDTHVSRYPISVYGAYDIAMADFDGDGKLDAVVVLDRMVSIMPGDGNGGFKKPIPLGLSGKTHSVVTADFNHDGHSDLAIAHDCDRVSVMLNDGSGRFVSSNLEAHHAIYSGVAVGNNSGSCAGDMTVVDLDNDGHPDVAGTYGGKVIWTLRNNGTGTLGNLSNITVANAAFLHTLITDDFNLDGSPDFAFCAENNSGVGSIGVMRSQGNTFVVSNYLPEDNSCLDLASADMNHDGVPDLVSGRYNALNVLIANASGTTFTQNNYPINTSVHMTAEFVTVADFNGDGAPDVAYAPWDARDRNLYVMINDGNGALGTPTGYFVHFEAMATEYSRILATDLNQDGRPDLVSLNTNELGVLINKGQNFDPVTEYPMHLFVRGSGARDAAVADFDGDGKPDIAATVYGSQTVNITPDTYKTTNEIVVLRNEGYASFGATSSFPSDVSMMLMVAADFNQDQRPDLVVTRQFERDIVLYVNNGAGFDAPVSYKPGINSQQDSQTSIASADFNGDGRPDLVVTNSNSGTVSVLRNNGRIFQTPLRFDAGSEPTQVVARDFNGDGLADVAVINASTRAVRVLLNTGSANLAAAVRYDAGTVNSPSNLAAGDFNGDGVLDLLVNDGQTSEIKVLINDGSGNFSTSSMFTLPSGLIPGRMLAGDFNDDGVQDLAVTTRGPSSDSSALLLILNGPGGPTTVRYDGVQNGKLMAADFNGDGKLDLAIGGGGAGAISILLNSPEKTATLIQHSAIGTIIDDDGVSCTAGTFDWAQPSFNSSEKKGSLTLKIARSGSSDGATSVRFSTGDGTATAPADYTAIEGQVVNFAAGQTLAKLTLPNFVVKDSIDEPKESFTLGLHDAAQSACIGNTQPMADGSIADDNAPPVLTLVGGDRSVSEGAGSVTVTASLSAPRGADTLVKLDINPSDMPQTNPASKRKDYLPPTDAEGNNVKSILIPAGSTTGTLVLTLVDDTVHEEDETIYIRLKPSTRYAIGSPNSVSLTLIDDDAAPARASGKAQSSTDRSSIAGR